jgi:hypothetical protein
MKTGQRSCSVLYNEERIPITNIESGYRQHFNWDMRTGLLGDLRVAGCGMFKERVHECGYWCHVTQVGRNGRPLRMQY